MEIIRPRLVTDRDHTPVAVQIDYAEWLVIEPLLRDRGLLDEPDARPTDALEALLRSTKGIWKEGDGLEYQRRIRAEWDDRSHDQEADAP